MSKFLHPLIMRAKVTAEVGFARAQAKFKADNALTESICETYINDNMRAQYNYKAKHPGTYDPDIREDSTIARMLKRKNQS